MTVLDSLVFSEVLRWKNGELWLCDFQVWVRGASGQVLASGRDGEECAVEWWPKLEVMSDQQRTTSYSCSALCRISCASSRLARLRTRLRMRPKPARSHAPGSINIEGMLLKCPSRVTNRLPVSNAVAAIQMSLVGSGVPCFLKTLTRAP